MDPKFEKLFDMWDVMGCTDSDVTVIAGGAVRDSILGKPIKDIDVVVSWARLNSQDKNGYYNFQKWLKENTTLMGGESEYPINSGKFPFKVYETHDKEINILSVGCEAIQFVAETFDFGFCQSVMTSSGNILVSDWFEKDVKDKAIRLYVRDSLSQYQIGRAVQYHLPRLQKKYPEYKFDVEFSKSSKPNSWDSYSE